MATKKEQLEQAQKAIGEYMELSKFLFGDDAPQDINEIDKDNPYYDIAKEIADEMNLDWYKMTPDESNRLMLNLLGEYFANIIPDDKYKATLTISFQKAD